MEYKVSNQTAELVRAYDLMADVYQHAYTALCMVYSEADTLEILGEKFEPCLNRLRLSVLELISMTFEDNRGQVGNDQV